MTSRRVTLSASAVANSDKPKDSGNVVVAARFRPQNSIEEAKGGTLCIKTYSDDPQRVDVESSDGSGADRAHTFAFDYVFGLNSSQEEVYEKSAKPVVCSVLEGYNGTVFAYGQTSSGKTYTMEGPDISDAVLKGIIPRMVSTIFDGMMAADPNIEFTVKVSMMEIYMERIRDLLDPNRNNLEIHEDRTRGVYVEGATEVYVADPNEVIQAMREGSSNRAVGSTKMNQDSSRSHSIFVLTVTQTNLLDYSKKIGKLYLVDLAGSEKVGKTGAEGVRLDEAKTINKSLACLGNVINALTDQKSTHIPYRDSKLTRVLQESLGGNSRTALVICCSPSSYNEHETVSTCRFGTRAKSIQNKPRVNREMSVPELKLLLAKAEKQIEELCRQVHKLEKQVKSLGGEVVGGLSDDGEDYNEQDDDIGDVRERLVDLEGKIAVLESEKDDLIQIQDVLLDQLKEKDVDHCETIRELEATITSMKTEERSITKENDILIQKLADLTFQYDKLNYDNGELLVELEESRASTNVLQTRCGELEKHVAESAVAAVTRNLENEERQSNPTPVDENKSNNSNDDNNNDRQQSLFNRLKSQEETWHKAAEDYLLQSIQESSARVGAIEGSLVKGGASTFTTQDKEAVQAAAEVAALTVQINELRQELKSMTDACQLTSDERDDYRNQLRAYEARGATKGNVEDMAKDIDRLKDCLEDSDRKYTRLEGLYQNRQLYITEAEAEWASQRTEHDRLHRKLQEELSSVKDKLKDQFNDFQSLKQSLVRDLQNRCEKVIELEVSLDEVREQYNKVLKNSGNKALTKKVIFLERNLEQLTCVYQQLVSQNSTLRVENQVADKKIMRKNERIEMLETRMKEKNDLYEKLLVKHQQTEEDLAKALHKLNMDSSSLANETAQYHQRFNTRSSSVLATHIVKPLRGGGGGSGGLGSPEHSSHPSYQTSFDSSSPISLSNIRPTIRSSVASPPSVRGGGVSPAVTSITTPSSLSFNNANDSKH